MNYDKIYNYRFRDISNKKKSETWNEISQFIKKQVRTTEIVLDPAAGMCEFINSFDAKEKWAVDLNKDIFKFASTSVKVIIGNNLNVDLPSSYFDLAYVSNFLEHLPNQEAVSQFLIKMFEVIKPGGSIIVMGPNFKYSYKNYFDFADHSVILTELGCVEHIVGAGFTPVRIVDRFLPLTFNGKLPVHPLLVKLYLRMPFTWKFMGKQFFIVAQK